MGKRVLIGVIITDCDVDFQGEIMRGIITQAFRSDCDIAALTPMNNFSYDSPHKNCEKNIFNLMLSDRFDGFIYDRDTLHSEEIRNYIDGLCRRSGKPVMLLDYNDHKNFETTSADDCTAFEKLTDHLIEVHGLKKIYCLTGPKDVFCARERLEGYFNSMKKHGLRYDRSCYEYGDFWHKAAEDLANKIIIGELERHEGIVCGNDVSAVRLIQTLMRSGIRVPEDIAVTGYDASDAGYNCTPTVTSYCRPNFQLGAEALRRLYRIITGKICRKVPNNNGSLRLGESCGCGADKMTKSTVHRVENIYKRHESDILYRSMISDITNTDSISDFSDKLDNYTYLLYRMAHFKICLTRNYMESTQNINVKNLDFDVNDEVRIVMSKNAIKREPVTDEYFRASELLDVYSQERSYPVAYYLAPLHYNDNFFGYAALSFGKIPYCFDKIFMLWMDYVNIGLEQVRIRSVIKNALSDSQRARNIDALTGLLSRSGLENMLREKAAAAPPNSELAVITVELSDLQKMYFRCGDKKSVENITAFCSAVKECVRPDELLGVWATHLLCVITPDEERASEIYSDLKTRIRRPEFIEKVEWSMEFSVGCSMLPLSGADMLSDAVYKSGANKVGICASDTEINPQYNKLCQLRNRIIKNPELPWKINEIASNMYLSKSYLQKIYKSFFNKSIIEEMIEFRIQKAKELLSTTDLTVTEVSRQCGYSSYNYFVRQFRTFESVSPSEYREKSSSI